MNRKDQMLIIIELLNDIDNANTIGGEYSIEYYEQIVKRCDAVSYQYPKSDPFFEIVSWLSGDMHFKIEEAIAKLSEVSK